MFGLDFLFLSALIGLPLIGLPVLLHLLHRSKSTIVLFSTTRFIQSSLQQTAARKKLQKWLLLAMRMLLILLLILMAAQPVKRLTASLGGQSAIAAIVVDTSYSMQAQSGDKQSLTQQVDQIIGSLLRNELGNAKVAVYRTQIDPSTEVLKSAGDQLAKWQDGKTEVSSKPLVERIEQAEKMLENQQADSKWLIVISDSQSKEFPRVLEPWNEGQTVFFDLHPSSIRSSGITQLTVDPYPPLPGVNEEAVIKVAGNHDQSRAVRLDISTLDGKVLSSSSPQMIGASENGESEIRIPFTMPAEPFVKLTAKLEGDDDLAFDNTCDYVLQSLSKQPVRFLNPVGLSSRFISLAIDPTEGRSKDWPLALRTSGSIQADDQALVTIFNDWPTIEQAVAMKQFVDQGKTVLLFLRPGLEARWNTLPDTQKQAILQLLPGTPIESKSPTRVFQAAATADSASFVKELVDPRFQISAISIYRYLPLERNGSATTLLTITNPRGSTNQGLLYKQTVGKGIIYTFTSLPDPQFSTLASHPMFLPMVVKACLPSNSDSLTQNKIVGESLKLNQARSEKMMVLTPAGEPFAVEKNAAGLYEFNRTMQRGLYTWKSQAGQIIAAASIAPPSDESLLNYRPPDSIAAGEHVTIARDLDEFRSKINSITQPQPKWSGFIATLLLLMCVETLLGNHSGFWKLIGRS